MTTFAELKAARSEAIENDPLKPGMWQVTEGGEVKRGHIREDQWKVIDRAAAKYGAAQKRAASNIERRATAEELEQWRAQR